MMIAVPVDAMTKFKLRAVCAGSDSCGPLLIAVADATVLNGLRAISRLLLIKSFLLTDAAAVICMFAK